MKLSRMRRAPWISIHSNDVYARHANAHTTDAILLVEEPTTFHCPSLSGHGFGRSGVGADLAWFGDDFLPALCPNADSVIDSREIKPLRVFFERAPMCTIAGE